MSGDIKRDELLGLRPTLPPAWLTEGCEFASDAEYRAFLENAKAHPELFWMEAGDKLLWNHPPQSIGGPGAWYTGARLDPVHMCLGADSERPALLTWRPGDDRPTSLSARELAMRSEGLARRISEWELTPRSRVLVATHDPELFWSAVFACFSKGLTCVPVNPNYAAERIIDRSEKSFCRGAFLDRDLVGVQSLAEALGRNRVALIDRKIDFDDASELESVEIDPMHPLFVVADSSGQLFSLPAGGFLVQSHVAHRYLLDGKRVERDLWILSEPHHASMLAAVLGSFIAGEAVGVLPHNTTSSRDELARAMVATGARSLLTNVKTIVPLTRDVQGDATGEAYKTSLELIVVEGETLEPHLCATLRDEMFGRGTHVVQVLARPEGGGFVAGPHPALTPVRPGSVAYAAPGLDLTILDQRGDECEMGYGGLMALKAVTPGLPVELQSRESSLVLEVKARRDRELRFWPMGEAAVEISTDEGVSLAELEATIAGVEGVEHVAVIRYVDDSGRTKSRAFIEPNDTVAHVVESVRTKITVRLGAKAVPTSFQLVPALPVGRSGKLLRSVLRRIITGDPISKEDAGMVADPDLIEQLSRGATVSD